MRDGPRAVPYNDNNVAPRGCPQFIKVISRIIALLAGI